ncbi:DNA-processing protein DprA [Persephonella sp.]
MSAIDYIQLSYIKGIGNKTLKLLINTFGSPENIFQLSFSELSSVAGHSVAELILKRDKNLRKKAEEEVLKAEKFGAEIIHFNDPSYPELLKEIPDPPMYLYCKGSTDFSNTVSVVGSRRYTAYGKTVTRQIVSFLSDQDVNIVSGLALGIDSIAHETALKKGQLTTAVLGCGIDVIYPAENKKLYNSIVENGAVISELPFGTPPYKHNFPNRNRIVAGISYATIVTEASEKSGALITARLANDYGRVVFSVPANINNPFAKGNNILIKEGAVPVIDIESITENLPYIRKQDKIEIELSEVERKILSVLSSSEHIDIIAEKTGISVPDLMVILFDMELKGLVVSENNIFTRTV